MPVIIKNGVNENTVVRSWLELVESGYSFTTDTRQDVRVRYAGKNSEVGGGDLRDAALEFDGRPVNGKIEFHVFAGDWRIHGHHRDKNYNGIVLQVVMWQRPGEVTFRENGQVVPTVAIGRFYDDIKQAGMGTEPHALMPCHGAGIESPEHTVAVLEQAGLRRFQEKAGSIQSALLEQPAGECLYGGIMEALGYAQNRRPFRKLANMIPSYLFSPENSFQAQASLYGAAGLLPSQRPVVNDPALDDYVCEMETAWRAAGERPVFTFNEWTFFRLRPANFPTRRLAGMQGLIQQYRDEGILPALERLIRKIPAEKNGKQLTESILVPAKGYWRHHFDFGKQCQGLSPWAIGASRAAEIVTNVVLPFFYASGRQRGDKTLAEKTAILYSFLPAGQDNTVSKHMVKQLGLKGSRVNTACRQQGLLHIYKNCCTQGKCRECDLAKLGLICF